MAREGTSHKPQTTSHKPRGRPPEQPRAGAAPAVGNARPLLAAGLLLLTFVTIPPAPCELDMDPSLSAVLNYAHQHQLQYGSDVVYTYGPWGFLIFFLFFPHAEGARMAVEDRKSTRLNSSHLVIS